MKGIVLRGVLWVFTGVLAWADSHLGPVTDLTVFNDQVYSCSQAGIFRGTGDDLTLLARPSIRVTSLSGLEDGVIYAGGQPGVAGSLGWLNPKTKQAGVIGKMGKDLVYGLAVLGDERFAVARADGEVWTSQFTKREPLPSQLVHKHTAAARAVAFSPDGRRAVTASEDQTAKIWEAETGKELLTLKGHDKSVITAAFSSAAFFASAAAFARAASRWRLASASW